MLRYIELYAVTSERDSHDQRVLEFNYDHVWIKTQGLWSNM